MARSLLAYGNIAGDMKALALLLALAAAVPALAQEGARYPDEPGYTAPGRRSSEPPKLTEPGRYFSGEVTDVNKAARTLTLRHGAIDILGVRSGTSEYTFKDASALEHFKVGDRVRFNAVLQGREFVVTSVAPY
jgi:Cu/Ag efflux protein CusF